MESVSFSHIAAVSCGTLSMELNRLREEGFLDTDHLRSLFLEQAERLGKAL